MKMDLQLSENASSVQVLVSLGYRFTKKMLGRVLSLSDSYISGDEFFAAYFFSALTL